MDKTPKKRSEIDNKYKWDLTKIYESNELWLNDFDKVKEQIKEVVKFKDNLVDNAKNLLDYLEVSMNLERKLYKLYYYAHLSYDQDTTDTKYQDIFGKITNLLSYYNELNSFATPLMMTIEYDKINEFYKDEPKLEEYKFTLEEIYRYKKHILTDIEESIISKFSNITNNPEETYNSLVDSDLKFGNIIVDGNEVELTESNYKVFIESKDRLVRKNAFQLLMNTYGNYKNTITKTFNGNVEVLTTLAKLKKFDSSLEASLFNENISVSVYNNLIDTVSNNLDVLYKYFDLCKSSLNLDEFHLYDQYLELVEDCDKEYTYEEAKELVLEALGVLGEDYIDNLNKAFNEGWIDVYNNIGKRGGAYSSGFYDTNPYILLNYEGRINDVSTLAHELGHSMHTYYSCLNNKYQYSSYRIFVAEVASTVNELLLNYHILNNTDDVKIKKYILSNMMKLFKATIYRQTMFAEFEKITHEMKENNEVFTYDKLCDKYYELNKKYFGNNVVVDEEIKYEWERIPHFYYNFYVYKYAIGLSCACYIVDNILNNKENALSNYKKFLSLGGSDYPINELKVAGVDATSKEVIESAIKMFDNLIEQFKAL